MIKTYKGTTEIKGNVTEVMADFTIIVKSIIDVLISRGMSAYEAEKEINGAIERSKLTKEELEAKILTEFFKLFGGM